MDLGTDYLDCQTPHWDDGCLDPGTAAITSLLILLWLSLYQKAQTNDHNHYLLPLGRQLALCFCGWSSLCLVSLQREVHDSYI